MSTDITESACRESEWARALYVAWVKYESAPIYDEMVAEFGRPVLLERAS